MEKRLLTIMDRWKTKIRGPRPLLPPFRGMARPLMGLNKFSTSTGDPSSFPFLQFLFPLQPLSHLHQSNIYLNRFFKSVKFQVGLQNHRYDTMLKLLFPSIVKNHTAFLTTPSAPLPGKTDEAVSKKPGESWSLFQNGWANTVPGLLTVLRQPSRAHPGSVTEPFSSFETVMETAPANTIIQKKEIQKKEIQKKEIQKSEPPPLSHIPLAVKTENFLLTRGTSVIRPMKQILKQTWKQTWLQTQSFNHTQLKKSRLGTARVPAVLKYHVNRTSNSETVDRNRRTEYITTGTQHITANDGNRNLAETLVYLKPPFQKVDTAAAPLTRQKPGSDSSPGTFQPGHSWQDTQGIPGASSQLHGKMMDRQLEPLMERLYDMLVRKIRIENEMRGW